MRRYREEEPLLNKDKMKTMAFSNLVGSIIFLAIGIWAWFQTCLLYTSELPTSDLV